MAKGKKKTKAAVAVASMDPDEMMVGGLADDFDAVVSRVRLVPWDYNGTIDHEVLGVAIDYEPDEGEDVEAFTQHYSCGELSHFVPSMDGETAIDLDDHDSPREGIYALQVGKKNALNNNTNWAHWIGAALDAGFPRENLAGDVSCFEGMHAHFNRIPQKKRSGIVVEDEEGRSRGNDILVPTEVYDLDGTTGGKAKGGKSKAKKGGKATKKAKAEPESDDPDELDVAMAEIVVDAVEDEDEGLPKSKLPGLMIKAFEGKDRAAAVKRAVTSEFLELELGWTYDADEGVVYPA